MTLDHGGLGRLTDARRKRFVPHAPVPAQTGQCAAAVETVSRVARVQNMGVGEMAVVLDFVAVAGDARLLAADKVETWRRSVKDGDRYLNIRRPVQKRPFLIENCCGASPEHANAEMLLCIKCVE